jgi:hypothetical protein
LESQVLYRCLQELNLLVKSSRKFLVLTREDWCSVQGCHLLSPLL